MCPNSETLYENVKNVSQEIEEIPGTLFVLTDI